MIPERPAHKAIMFTIPLVVCVSLAAMWVTDGSPFGDAGDGPPGAEAGQVAEAMAPPEPTRPTIRDADPADWHECMDRVFELSNNVQYLYENGTIILSDKHSIYTENIHRVSNMMWYIAVCDRMFPANP